MTRVEGPRPEPQLAVGVSSTGAGRGTRPSGAGRVHETGGKRGRSDRTRCHVVDVRRPDDETGVQCEQLGFVDRPRRTDAVPHNIYIDFFHEGVAAGLLAARRGSRTQWSRSWGLGSSPPENM